MADTDQVLNLAAIIREVDGAPSKGAAALAESILDHPRFRAVLAGEPAEPEGREPVAVITEPSDEEWDALVERVWDKYETVGYQGERFMYDGDFGSALDLVRKELSRWGHQPAPVPVSERLPGPGDCDAEGKCWWGRSESHDWSADWTFATHKAVAEFCEFSPQTAWLPAHALPLPEVDE